MEYRLFSDVIVPDFTTVEFFSEHGWISPDEQIGHRERIGMVSQLVRDMVDVWDVSSVVDLGCGDGSLLLALSGIPAKLWGYDAGMQNVAVAQNNGLDVRVADILAPGLEYGELVIASEVVEHLLDPHSFIAGLPGRCIVLSSPSAEDADWHYEHHAWAWDIEGYAKLVAEAGWKVVQHRECEAPDAFHGGIQRQQRFQAIAAIKDQSL